MTDLAAIRIPVDTSDVPKAIQIVNKLQTELVSFEKAVRSGTLTVFSQNAAIAKSAKQLEALGYSYWEAKGAVNSFAQGLKTLNDAQLAQAGRGLNQSQRDMRNFELGVQQAGYQIGDFAVQVQSGTSPLVAFSQQISQLAGFFGGPWGAAVGAAAAVLGGLAVAFWDTRDAAKAFKDGLDGVEDSLQRLRDAQANFSTEGIDDLVEKYGQVDEAVNRLIQSEMRLAEIRANSQINELVSSLQDMSRWYDIGISDAASSMLALRDAFNLTKNDAESLYVAIQDVGKAQGFEEKADALAKVNQYLGIILSAQEEVTDEQLQMAENFLQAESLARQLANSAPSEGWMDSAIKGVQGLLDKLWEAVGAAGQLGGPNVDIAGNPIVVPEGAMSPPKRAPSGFGGIDWGTAPETGGGGGGIDEVEQLREQYEALLGSMDPVIAAQNEYNDSLEMLNEALAAGAINGQEYEDALEKIKVKLQESLDPLAQFQQSLEDALNPEKNYMKGLQALQQSLSDFLFNPFEVGIEGMILSFATALQRMLADVIAANIMQTLFNGPLGAGGSIGNFFMGILGSANGNVFSGGNVMAFANGGVVNGPTFFPMNGSKTGLMGEAGPEAILPLKRGSNGKLGVETSGEKVNVNTKVINVLDPSIVGDYLNTSEGERLIMNVMRKTGNARI